MKDIFGNVLNVGDTVAFMQPSYTYSLMIGEIIKLTPQKVLIRWNNSVYGPNDVTETYKFPEQVAKKI